MSWYLSIRFYGENFIPSKADYRFSDSNDSGDLGLIGRYKNKPRPYGQATIVGTDRNIIGLCEKALEIKNTLFSVGATEIELCITRAYKSQCNEELSINEIAIIAKLKCHLSYSAYLEDGE